MQRARFVSLASFAHQAHLPGDREKRNKRVLNVLVTVWSVMRMESIDDPHLRIGVSMSVTRSIAALSVIFMSSAFAVAEEPSSQWLASVGLANLQTVTTQESMEVRGQGFSTGVSRSASAVARWAERGDLLPNFSRLCLSALCLSSALRTSRLP